MSSTPEPTKLSSNFARTSLSTDKGSKHSSPKGTPKGGTPAPGSPSLGTPNGSRKEEGEENGGEVNKDNREGLLKLLSKVLGADVTAITLPVSVCEPTSFLMRLAEAIQYYDLLDKAADSEEATERLMWVSVFACSVYVTNDRQAKPFNPLLGETYEFTKPADNNYRFFAEQVSHHPPVGACIAENDHWKFWQSQSLKTKFTGNSLECQGTGTSNVLLKKSGEHFSWESVRTVVHNLIVGKLWVDNFGDITVLNSTSGDKAQIKMKQCGWFSKNWRELEGDVFDKEGNIGMHIWGKYNESIFAKPGEGSTSDTKKERKKKFKYIKKEGDNEPVWTHTIKPLPLEKVPSKYATDYTDLTLELIRLDDAMAKHLPPTDARLRLDRLALEKGDTSTAGKEKHNLEERQREARKKREKDGIPHVPKYFQLTKDESGREAWEYKGGYWEDRDARISALSPGAGEQ